MSIGLTFLFDSGKLIQKIISVYLVLSTPKPAGGRGASVSACAGLTNQLVSCWVDPRIAFKKH